MNAWLDSDRGIASCWFIHPLIPDVWTLPMDASVGPKLACVRNLAASGLLTEVVVVVRVVAPPSKLTEVTEAPPTTATTNR